MPAFSIWAARWDELQGRFSVCTANQPFRKKLSNATLILRKLAAQTERVRRLGLTETALMSQTQGQVVEGVKEIQTVLRRTGINPDQFAQRIEAVEGVGGPEIPLQSVHIEGIADATFQDAYLRASAVLDQMNQLLMGMRHVPLTTPVCGRGIRAHQRFWAAGRSVYRPLCFPSGARFRRSLGGDCPLNGPRNRGLGGRTRYLRKDGRN